jgi:glycosyltransferase involved in cell wall biosynthesis
MNYGLPTIVNANGSITEIPQDAVWMLPDEFKDAELIEALKILRGDAERRQALGARAREEILTLHSPRACAEQYAQAIENFYAGEQTKKQALVDALVRLGNVPPDEKTIMALATNIAQNLPLKRPANQLLVDVSTLVQLDAKSGIQRVTRSILKELLHDPPTGYRVEPVYATADCLGYRYARNFTLRFLECPAGGLADDPIEAQTGDIFLGLDLQPQVVSAQVDILESFRHSGVRIYFVVYDMLPILLSHSFPKEVEAGYANWLNAIVRFDGALCISRTVADELREWLKTNGPKRLRSFKIGWFHLGADIENSMPTRGLPDDAPQVLAKLAARTSFLIVGTIEPRKGHTQTLAAFEQLWAEGVDANLVIVGKQGWKVETLVDTLRKHPERGKRLFWLEDISDEYLEKVYAASTCFIAASEGEGFGLPLIEAARHKLLIIARYIPVFREVAGEHAFYFNGKEPTDLAKAVREWLGLYQSGRHPKSDDIPWLIWKQSTEKLLDIILLGQWYTEWKNRKPSQ